ncbi:MAG: histidine phosphatase family protein [Candidatus Paceibacterota bacterium]|jgi:phosphohistidine phosphatase SixA|nr:histidine phosphatase family protein [Candidatus Paceibacterota bacterium]
MAMIRRFIFARHANTDKNPIDKERKITETGRAQAAVLKKRIRKIYFDTILCSSSNRAKETIFCLFEKNKKLFF